QVAQRLKAGRAAQWQFVRVRAARVHGVAEVGQARDGEAAQGAAPAAQAAGHELVPKRRLAPVAAARAGPVAVLDRRVAEAAQAVVLARRGGTGEGRRAREGRGSQAGGGPGGLVVEEPAAVPEGADAEHMAHLVQDRAHEPTGGAEVLD